MPRVNHQPTVSAICRECSKEFGSAQGVNVYHTIRAHVEGNPGHVVLGGEHMRFIWKGKKRHV